MNYGFIGKPFPFGKPFGFSPGPYFIGPGFATYPAAGATIGSGFSKSIPVTRVAVAPFGKPWGI